MSTRRSADPRNIQLVWDAIRTLNSQRIPPDISRMVKFMERVVHFSPAQSELYIKQVEEDELIITSVQKTGTPDVIYRIPTEKEVPLDDGYDWYCIECHQAGEVLACRDCYRVFHKECSLQASYKAMPQKHPSKKSTISTLNDPTTNSPIINAKSGHLASTNDSQNGAQSPSNGDTEIKRGGAGGPSFADQQIPANSACSVLDMDVIQIQDEEDAQCKEQTDAKREGSKSDKTGYDVTVCCMCNLARGSSNCELITDEVNHLLGYILQRIKSWVPDRLTNKMSAETKADWCTEAELSWRSGQLFYQHMDMSVIELKLRTKQYTRMCDFHADVVTIQHNIAIFHGMDSQEYGAAELMMRDCNHDISEIQNCIDCYKHSNEKVNNKWFCFPCRKAHRLVWAKQKGYPYWPAKVLKESDSTCDVRFFGGKYERSILSKMFLKPIETSLTALQIKKSIPFNKAVEELKLHRLLLDNPDDVDNIMLLNSKPTKPMKPIGRKSSTVTTLAPVTINLSGNSSKRKSTDSSLSTTSSSGRGRRKKSSVRESNDFDINDVGYVPNNSSFDESFANRLPDELIPQPSSSKKRKSSEVLSPPETPEKVPNDVIDISDGDEFHPELNMNGLTQRYDSSEQVSSSTEAEYLRANEDSFGVVRDSTDVTMQPLDQQYCDAVEKMRRKMEQCKDREQMIKIAMDAMQHHVDSIISQNNDHLKTLFETHNQQISDTKKKQWCYHCEQDAIYHCCWNTAYCSPTCQQQHWQSEHKKVCRRKRDPSK